MFANSDNNADDNHEATFVEPSGVEDVEHSGGLIEYDSSWCEKPVARKILGGGVFVVALIVCLSILIRVATYEQVIASDEVVFAAVGDWGYHGLNHEREVAKAMARWCLDNGCHCALSTGDNFYPNGVQSVDDDHFSSSFEQVFNGTGLSRVPFLVSVGNHDYYGQVSAQIDYGRINPRWYFPSRYYTKTVARRSFNLRLVAIDTTPLVPVYADSPEINHTDYDAQDAQAQVTWLTDVLANTPENTINIVFGHHPSVTPVDLHAEAPAMLQSIFEAYKVPLVISGHAHNLEHVWYEGQNVPQYAGTGAGGILVHPEKVGPAYCRNCSSWLEVQNGFLGVRVNRQRINLQFWSMSSILLREANIWLD